MNRRVKKSSNIAPFGYGVEHDVLEFAFCSEEDVKDGFCLIEKDINGL